MKREMTFIVPGENPIVCQKRDDREVVQASVRRAECSQCGARAYETTMRSWNAERGWVEQRGWQCTRFRLN